MSRFPFLKLLAKEETLLTESLRLVEQAGKSEGMSGLERWLLSMDHKEPDRIPVRVSSMEHNSRAAGYTIKEILMDSSKAVVAAIATLAKYGSDALIPYADPHIVGPEEMGSKIRYPEDGTAVYTNYVLGEKEKLGELKVPDPYNDGKLPLVIKAIEATSELAGDKVFLMQNLNGPFGHAGDLRGPRQLLLDVVLDPEFVKELMEFTTKVTITICRAIQKAGAFPYPFDAMAAPEYIGKRAYLSMVNPYQKRVVEALQPKGCAVGIDGDVSDIIDDYGSLGAQIIFLEPSEYSSSDLELFKQRVGHITSLLVDRVWSRELFHYTPQQIELLIRDSIGPWVKGGGCFIAAGVVPADAPSENVLAVVEGVKKYGRYPL